MMLSMIAVQYLDQGFSKILNFADRPKKKNTRFFFFKNPPKPGAALASPAGKPSSGICMQKEDC